LFWLRPVRTPGSERRSDMAAYQRDILERLSAVEGVSGAALSYAFPTITRTPSRMLLTPVSHLDAAAGAAESGAQAERVSPGFFDLLGIKVIRGRGFEWQDDQGHPAVVIINASLARQLFSGAGADGDAAAVAIGKRIRVGADPKAPAAEIVGVVTDASPGDVRLARLPTVYRPILQEPAFLQNPIFVLRARGTEGFAASVRRIVTASGRFYVVEVRSIEDQIARTMLTERTLVVLSSFVGGLSVLLAALGLYSLLAYSVGRRMRELALRMALGASHTAVRAMVIREGMTLAVLGLVVGMPLAVASGRLSRSYLEELPAASVGLVVAVGAMLLAIGLIAVAAPARRAARTDPAVALRE
jgi:hypothetical protein